VPTPARGGLLTRALKWGTLLKSGYFIDIGSSGMKTVAASHRHAAIAAVAHILRMNCGKMAGDKAGQPAYEILAQKIHF